MKYLLLSVLFIWPLSVAAHPGHDHGEVSSEAKKPIEIRQTLLPEKQSFWQEHFHELAALGGLVLLAGAAGLIVKKKRKS